MDISKNNDSSGSKSHRGMKTAAVVAAIGLASLAVAKGLKTRRGGALKKKAVTKGRKVIRQVKSAARSKTGARKSASRAR